MQKIIVIIISFLLASCSLKNQKKITIKSESLKDLDSLVVYINFKTIAKINKMHKGFDTTINYLYSQLPNFKYVDTYIAIYNKGAMLSRFYNYNAWNSSISLPQTIDVRVTNNSELKVKF